MEGNSAYLIRRYLGRNFLEVSQALLCKFPRFYKEGIIR